VTGGPSNTSRVGPNQTITVGPNGVDIPRQSLHGRIERALVTGATGNADTDGLGGLVEDVLDDLNSAAESARSLQQELDVLWRDAPR
jgi:hypothetical protein